MQHFTIKRSIPVGNHFHSDKDEDFTFSAEVDNIIIVVLMLMDGFLLGRNFL